jgi:hypothetical protein
MLLWKYPAIIVEGFLSQVPATKTRPIACAHHVEKPEKLSGSATRCTPILTTEQTSERVRQRGQHEIRAIGSNTASGILTKRKEIGFYKPSGTEESEKNTFVKMDSLGLIAKMDSSLASNSR